MKIAVGSDHGGFELKNNVISFLNSEGYEVLDCGTYSLDSCDYPIFGKEVAKKVASGECNYGVVICTTGEGISMAANKVEGVRCGIAFNDDVVSFMRKHNNANVIAFGAKYTTPEQAYNRLKTFLNTEFEGGRHQRRVNLL